MSRHRTLAFGAICLLSGAAWMASAQLRQSSVKLHEDMQPPAGQVARTAGRIADGVPIIGPNPEAKQNPTAIASQDKLISKPPTDNNSPTSKGEPVHGSKDFGADRQTETKPDLITGADNELHYIEVFNPSIVPFKRMSSLDAVREDYTLYASSTALAEIRVGGEARPNHDRFFASILVDLKPGLDIPIPSVSPGMRVLSYESSPKTDLVFSKDAASNFYLRTDEAGAANTYRVVFLVEASPYYFAPTLPRRLRVRDIPSTLIQPLPENVLRAAKSVLFDLDLDKHSTAKTAIDSLVYYFRSFEAKSPPRSSGNIYLDLVKSQAGVCRHRSFAFMVTANALGIPTRYVANEAHAWVEVWLPNSDWMRIDLGGAASELNVSNAEDKAMYQPRSEDPFSKPDKYKENYTRLEGEVSGLSDEQIAERQTRYAGKDGSGEGNGSFFGNEDSAPLEAVDEGGEEGPLTGPGSGLPQIPDKDLVGKRLTYMSVFSASPSGYRGETIEVRGVVYDADRDGLEGLRINIFLMPPGDDGENALRIGVGLSDENGEFTANVELPTSLDTAEYEVYVSTPGNREYQPAVSD